MSIKQQIFSCHIIFIKFLCSQSCITRCIDIISSMYLPFSGCMWQAWDLHVIIYVHMLDLFPSSFKVVLKLLNIIKLLT